MTGRGRFGGPAPGFFASSLRRQTSSLPTPASGRAAEPRALLTMAHYPGTLAAARCLAAAGVPVDVVADRHFALAAWSRAAARTRPGPRMDDPTRTLAWLLSI